MMIFEKCDSRLITFSLALVLHVADEDPSVFKARGGNRETSGAREVEETRDTAVDLPIDQVEAEEVKVSQ